MPFRIRTNSSAEAVWCFAGPAFYLLNLSSTQGPIIWLVLRQHLHGKVMQCLMNCLDFIYRQVSGQPFGGVTRHALSTINCSIAKRDVVSHCTTASAERRAGRELADHNNPHMIDIVKISNQASFVHVRRPTSGAGLFCAAKSGSVCSRTNNKRPRLGKEHNVLFGGYIRRHI